MRSSGRLDRGQKSNHDDLNNHNQCFDNDREDKVEHKESMEFLVYRWEAPRSTVR